MPRKDREQAIQWVNHLWQVTQSAPQPAQVHVECQKIKDALLEFISEKDSAGSEKDA